MCQLGAKFFAVLQLKDFLQARIKGNLKNILITAELKNEPISKLTFIAICQNDAWTCSGLCCLENN